ncbi:unnamed protein product [Toxocara canis]|uniref:GLOBIN domain-containing protein n=1 Tax=Toxocara canis TaxID=6265 RepID=A0A183VDF7_TOXCA|nr:unnamed protein product [Toxocara canis]
MFTTRTFLSAMSRSDIATLRDHARVTVKMINHVIKNLDQEAKKRNDTGSELDPRLIGRAHGNLRPYGFTGNYWEKLGETIIDVVLAQEAVRDLPGAGQAWVVLTACLVDQLRAGFDESKSHSSMSMVTQKVLYNAAAQLDDMISPETSAECCSGMYVTAPSSYSPGNFPAQPLPLQFVSDAIPVCSYLCGVRGKSHTEERKSRIDTCDTCNEPRIQHRDSRDVHSDSRAISVEPVESRDELRETRAEDACEFHRMRRQSVRDARRRSRHEANQTTAEAQASIAANINSSNGTNGFLPATTSTFDS